MVGTEPATASLRRYAMAAASRGAQVTLRVVGSAEAERLNARYRRRKYASNVLSFRYRQRPLAGDVVLCHPVIAAEARAQGKTLAAHYAHLVVHGMLHLRGYDHARKREATRMEQAEVRLLRQLGFGDPYALPAAVK